MDTENKNTEKKEEIKETDPLSSLEEVGIPENLVTDEDAEELLRWMMGLTSSPPKSIQKLMSNLATKLNVAMATLVTMNLSRMKTLSNFLQQSEEYVFDKSKIASMEDEDIVALYEKANKSLNSTMEFTRKFIVQNKDSLQGGSKEIDEIKELLSTLPVDKIKEISEKIEKGEL